MNDESKSSLGDNDLLDAFSNGDDNFSPIVGEEDGLEDDGDIYTDDGQENW